MSACAMARTRACASPYVSRRHPPSSARSARNGLSGATVAQCTSRSVMRSGYAPSGCGETACSVPSPPRVITTSAGSTRGVWSGVARPMVMVPCRSLAIESPERSALAREALEQRRRRPPGAELRVELRDARVNAREPDAVRVEQRSAAPRREAVAVDVDGIDIRGAQRKPEFESARAFVDECVDRPLDDLARREGALRDAGLVRLRADERDDLGIDPGFAVVPVLIPALARLLPESARLDERRLDERTTLRRIA